MSTDDLPKAILYSWPTSVWSTVPRLCLREKGYSEDEYVIKQVNLSKGENFAPSYLKINMNGTIPTLVVPMIETTGTGMDTRFRSLRDTITICDFLDQARGANSTRTVSDRPAPALAPATIEGKAVSDKVIALVHLPIVDPNFLQLSASTPEELRANAQAEAGQMLSDRRHSLQGYLAEAEQLAKDAAAGKTKDGKETTTYEQRMVAFLKEKQAANQMLWEVFFGEADEERTGAFFDASKKAWTEGVPDTLSKLDATIKGPYVLGDQVSLADLHLIAWLTRLVFLAGGGPSADGIDKLEATTGSRAIGKKLRAFWAAWTERESFKIEYGSGLH